MVFINSFSTIQIFTNSEIAGGSWTAGSSVDDSKLAASAPSWIQLLTDGVKVTEAGNICHPFRGGQFGWVGVIMQYKDGKWVKLSTVNDWVPNKEGQFMSCAQAPAAGTYALFGYFTTSSVAVAPIEEPGFDCNANITWSINTYMGDVLYIDGFVYGVPEGTIISYVIDSSRSSGLTGSGSTTTDSDGHFVITTELSEYSGFVYFILHESTNNCSPMTDVVAD